MARDIENRKPTILNKSIAQSNYDYIIQIDGDIIMNKYFVHSLQRKGFIYMVLE
jgi:hypothetical protein